MATQGDDGYWRQDNDTSSGRFSTREQADAQQYRNARGSGGGGGMAGAGAAGLVYGVLLALLAVAAVVITGAKVILLLVKMFPLYVVWIAAVLAALIVVPRLIPGVRRSGIARIIFGLLGAAAAGWLLVKPIDAIYSNSNAVLPSYFISDYIQALPDGSAPKLYEKRHGKGTVITELAPGEKVQVAGLGFYGLFDSKYPSVKIERIGADPEPASDEFFITTKAGLSGWVTAEAFPKDANAGPKGQTMTLGAVSSDLKIDALERDFAAAPGRFDRDFVRLASKYLESEVDWGRYYRFKPEFKDKVIPVNLECPFTYVNTKREDKPAVFTLAGIFYAGDCVIIEFNAREYDMFNGYTDPQYEWNQSLTVTDLDTGAAYKVINADTGRLRGDSIKGANLTERINSYRYIFPPFTSRRFSLTHTAPPAAGKLLEKGGYTKWDIPEVRVPN